MTPLLSQIVRLTKSILLRPSDVSKRPSFQFFPGKPVHLGFQTGGIAVSWWRNDDTFYARDAVVALIVEQSIEFRGCDLESVADAVMETLKEVCLDRTIFDGDAVVFARFATLFECRSVSVPIFANAIREEIEIRLRARLGKWCTVHALPRFKVRSFLIDEESIRVIGRNDFDAWEALKKSGYQFNGWTPERATLGSNGETTFSPPDKFECLLVAEELGTAKGARFDSMLKFSKLTALMVAVASERAPYPFHKSAARPYTFCVQFPHLNNDDTSIIRNDFSPVAPYFASDVPINDEDIDVIQQWYSQCYKCGDATRNRLEKGAHFLSRAINSSDIEAYINYFVTLDALFGQRGSVELSILAGVRELKVSPIYSEKASWLFDLRNELVHGGSRYVAEWPKYTKYALHFRSSPMADVQYLAQHAVLQAPYILTT